jgi:hypothetical protein
LVSLDGDMAFYRRWTAVGGEKAAEEPPMECEMRNTGLIILRSAQVDVRVIFSCLALNARGRKRA